MVTEAGGLIGNFTGDSDFLYQREVVAGNPKVYGQLVTMLAPYTRVIANEPAADAQQPTAQAGTGSTSLASAMSPAEALLRTAQPAEPKKGPVRLRKLTVGGQDAPM